MKRAAQIEKRLDQIKQRLAVIDLRHADFCREARAAIARNASRAEKDAIKARAMKDTADAPHLCREREDLRKELYALYATLVDKAVRLKRRVNGGAK